MRGRFDNLLVDDMKARGQIQLGTDPGHSLAVLGATPISQMITLSSAGFSTAGSLFAAGQAGFTSVSQVDALVNRVLQMRQTLINFGFERGT